MFRGFLLCLMLHTAGVLGEEPDPVGDGVARLPDVLLISVDTLRADALGWVGGHDRTPRLDALARSGAAFSHGVAPAPVTQPSHATLLTGLLPRSHGLRDNGGRFPTSVSTLADLLGDAGWTTAGFVSGHPLTSLFGFGRDFDHYDDRLEPESGERRAPSTVAATLEWRRSQSGPVFTWVHLFDPHDPYEGPEDAPAGYAGEVVGVDREIGRLLEQWPGPGPPLVVFVADHGESLGEHGERTHGFFVYESTIRVPVVFSWPGRIPPSRSTAPVRLLDVAPTVLALLGLPVPMGLDGVDLSARLSEPTRETEALPPTLVESWRPWASYGWAPLRAVRDGRWKLIVAPQPELYDLESDPGETRNLVRRRGAEARRLKAIYEDLTRGDSAPGLPAEPEALARLEALGYVGSGADPAAAGSDAELLRLADPKDRIESWNALSDALAHLEAGRFEQALAAFDAVAIEQPGNPFPQLRGAVAAWALGDSAGAFARLGRGLELRPDDADGHALAGTWRLKVGDLPGAEASWARLCQLRPGDPGAWEGLAVATGRQGKAGEARAAFERAVHLEPTVARWLQLIRLALAAGDEAGALEALAAARSLDERALEAGLSADPALRRALSGG